MSSITVDLKVLELFRDLKISLDKLDKQTYSFAPLEYYYSVPFCKEHLIHLLEKYQKKEISDQDVIAWVNFVLFSEWYGYCEKYQDHIGSILYRLEEIDEEGQELTPEKIELYLYALRNNLEVWKLEKNK